MADLSKTIAPKSDQLNADDLITGPRIIKITDVSAKNSSADQPVSIHFEGDNGKPYKPCLSMRRVMVQVWGKDGKSYIGRSMELYLNPEVTFGGAKVGGIRISRMSHMDKPITMALTATRAQRKPYTVKPLEVTPEVDNGKLQAIIANLEDAANSGMDVFRNAWEASWRNSNEQERGKLKLELDRLKQIAQNADDEAKEQDEFSRQEEEQ